jgi:hypothetical protein
MTVDEELSHLEEGIRRLKIDYDVYFGGGSKRPPADAEWRVQTALKKYSTGQGMNFGQRFRFNTLSQRYSLYNGLWQQKLKIKEEGYRRPQDAVLGIAGMRIAEQQAAEAAMRKQGSPQTFRIDVADTESDHANVERLFNAMIAMRKSSGEVSPAGTLESFKVFVAMKTSQIRRDFSCDKVEYSVDLDNGRVRLKAKAKS